ncbi:MAG: hypothetical protein OYI31_08260 [Chloroflexota bacterium]|nr:hypothetical protein [Chloroflexota bacterium]MDE2940875.1 hypothetical protein [Chloroflexota bacterium]MDE3268424.1 hypothetical protein [Chloroflexota bacterium]
MEDKTLTVHPQGKRGVNISTQKYETMRSAISEALRGSEGLTYTALVSEVGRRVGASFEGSIKWYTVVVKQDMEARGLLRRVPGTRPQLLRLVSDENPPGR